MPNGISSQGYDSWMQLLTIGDYADDGKAYYSGASPGWTAGIWRDYLDKLLHNTDHPYAGIVTDRWARVSDNPSYVPATAEENSPEALREWAMGGALNDADATRKSRASTPTITQSGGPQEEKSFGTHFLEFLGSFSPTNVMLRAAGIGSGPSWSVTDLAINGIIIIVAIILLAIAAYSVIAPPGTARKLAMSAVA